MPVGDKNGAASRLNLDSRLADLEKLLPWVEALAAEYSIPADTQFAIHLCLEEALSNIICHGYRSEPGHPITVDCTLDRPELEFAVEDQAPPFDPLAPLAVPDREAASPVDRLQLGGHGIRFMRKFAGSMAYQRLANGNRLTFGFMIPGSNFAA